MDSNNIPCSKCNGKGKIEGFSMVASGVCFQCKGIGYTLGTKKEYKIYIQTKEDQRQSYQRDKQEKELEKYLWDNASVLRSNIKMVINIKENENIENNEESKYVYNRQKKKIAEFLTQYKLYKTTYNKTLIRIEDILNEYKITCV